VEVAVFDPIWLSVFGAQQQQQQPDGGGESGVKRAASVICTSIAATFLSQGLHNGQIKM